MELLELKVDSGLILFSDPCDHHQIGAHPAGNETGKEAALLFI